LPGGSSRNARKRGWLPGRCGLLPRTCFSKQDGLLAPRRLQERDRKIVAPQPALAKVALLRERCRAKRHCAASSGDKAEQGPTQNAVEVAGLDRIRFFRLISLASFLLIRACDPARRQILKTLKRFFSLPANFSFQTRYPTPSRFIHRQLGVNVPSAGMLLRFWYPCLAVFGRHGKFHLRLLCGYGEHFSHFVICSPAA